MKNEKIRTGFLLAALGMIYCDIGASPLYVMRFIVTGSGGADAVTGSAVVGSISLILWSVLLLTAIKGVLILLRADNQGEGGHFALYALVRDKGRWLLFPAVLGGAALLADAVLTPALTMTAAVEGLRFVPVTGFSSVGTIGIVLIAVAVLTVLFLIQSAGSLRTGRFLGPVMLLWLIFIGIAGILHLSSAPEILNAFNPLCGIRFLFSSGNRMGFALLGLVFLAVTGTEVLYANLDFAGRKAITLAWPFVMICLFLSYLGQGAWLLCHIGDPALTSAVVPDPFFLMLPSWLRIPALLLAVAAAWTASQAVINGSFTIVSEAIRLDLLPAVRIRWPANVIQQEYIPSVNWLLWLGSCLAVIGFRTSGKMASAYGLCIAVAMLTTTILLYMFVRSIRGKPVLAVIVLVLFGVPEAAFLIASLGKLMTGGQIVALLTLVLFIAMLSWKRGREIELRYSCRVKLSDFIQQLTELRESSAYPLFTDNLVYVESEEDTDTIDKSFIWSILDRDLKRARTYWFISVHIVGEPYAERYTIETFDTDYVFRVRLELGFKCARPVTWYLRNVFRELQESGRIAPQHREYGIEEKSAYGVFHYCVIHKVPTDSTVFSFMDNMAISIKNRMQRLAGFREEWYAEENTDVSVEITPLDLDEPQAEEKLSRIWPDFTERSREKNGLDEEEQL